MLFLVVLFVVILNESERRIPIQQTGSGLAGAGDINKPYLPLKINRAGVIPVIFSSALISAPVTIAQILLNLTILKMDLYCSPKIIFSLELNRELVYLCRISNIFYVLIFTSANES